MRCDEARDRLVARDDGELSPGEATQVDEHLRGCAACAAHRGALQAVTPRPRARPPAHALRRLDDALDVDLLLAKAAEAPAAEPLSTRARRFFGAEVTVPRTHALAYAAALLLAVGLAVAGWWSGEAPATVADHAAPLPSVQYEPASFRPAPAPAAPEGSPDAGFR